jgi:hypothetical protein
MNAWHGRKARKPKTLDNWRNEFKATESALPQVDATNNDLETIVSRANTTYNASIKLARSYQSRADGIEAVFHGVVGFCTTGQPELPL